MKKTLITLVIVFLTFSAYSQKEESTLLKYSFKNTNTDSLKMFFANWENEYKPISDKQFNNLSDTLKDLYTLFADLYTPFNLNRLGGSEFGDSIYNHVEYYIVQNRIDYAIAETLEPKEIILNYYKKTLSESSKIEAIVRNFSKDTSEYSLEFQHYSLIEQLHIDNVKDFRPDINSGSVGVVFLKPEYSRIINDFLGKKHSNVGSENIMQPSKARGKSRSRLDWLNTKVLIFHGHWGGYWQMITYPQVSQIIFDKERKNALVYFRIIYEGGFATYKKIDGKWIMQDTKMTWIE